MEKYPDDLEVFGAKMIYKGLERFINKHPKK
jgi:hypothetical protein